ncbi:MAG TPA: DNA polymerase III subunit alpha [bacterium]|nr:DNA polymerase III subunit alpha [bacterium]
MTRFVHLHNHTHYSLLDGACRISDLVRTAKRFKMPALAITDHGNMFGVISFYQQVMEAGIKPIIGMEAYVAPESHKKRGGGQKGGGGAFHLILLARNMDGYRNLMRLSSLGYLEGFYYKPRIDRDLLQTYSEGLIALSACIKGEVPYHIIHDDMEGAKKAARFYKKLFKENYYLEIQNHGLDDEHKAIKGLIELSVELNIPLVATNDTHYLKQSHSEAQDILLCLQTNKDRDDPQRMRFSTDQLYLKSSEEMNQLFKEIPDSLTNTLEIADKCNLVLDFEQHHLPSFKIPPEEGIYTLNEFLEKKARDGLMKKGPVTPELEKRLEYELSVIEKMGFSSYFLIVADFIQYARKHDIPVGPGRGSAAGSLVAYALGITNVDPIKYNLLFERFLNPERVSMPDIDIDFCYENRDRIIGYVKKQYGGDTNVSQIITFGSMKTRGVIRDVGRVLKIPYAEVDRIAKLVPALPGITLDQALAKVPELKELSGRKPYDELIAYSKVLEGMARHASTHAAGVVIAPGDLMNFVPLYKSGKEDITTQYDMNSLESIGLLKMDFLGLRTLTVIDQTLKALKNKGNQVDIQNIPLDDEETYNLFAKGLTVGIFQFESAGMRDYLKKLRPGCIEDLVAMNALYRPGPMEWLDNFIERKHGKIPVDYIHPDLEPILKETYGIIVYQEQVMQIANSIAGFTLNKADELRKAMGKKKHALMQKYRNDFITGAIQHKGLEREEAEKIYDKIEKFAGYGFNKSHAVCYAIVAYQTAYLKAHYPLEFMAANLTSEMNTSERIITLIDECRRMGISILPPDINESEARFTVSEKGIRFGLGAVKNVGIGAIQSITEARERQGKFRTLFDLCKSIDLCRVNKKVLESLVQCGATDSLEGTRAQKMDALSSAVALAQSHQQSEKRGQTSIFGEKEGSSAIDPPLPNVDPWPQSQKLLFERELLGFYISGHPLEKYRDEVRAFTSPHPDNYSGIPSGHSVRFCGMISDIRQSYDRFNKPYAFFMLEGFSHQVRIAVFSEVYEKNRRLIEKDKMVVVEGRLERRNGGDEISITALNMWPLESARQQLTKRLILQIYTEKIDEDLIRRIQEQLKRYPGTCRTLINVHVKGKEILMRSKTIRVRPKKSLINELRGILGAENVWIEG